MPQQRPIRPVRILPEDVANKIAAGEVVERPASVVKELVENALDAGATRISVRLVAGGRRTIEVLDNGHGMSEQDALLAIERHATSKIRNADDLDNITTMGFRGEALASIAAVSRFELLTRREKDDAATRLRVEGGVLRNVEKASAPVGTRISVNRLYFNTPVRAKFLKGLATELGQCIDAVQRPALAWEGIGFQLFHNDKLLLDVPENATLRERIALIWGLGFARELVPLKAEKAGMRFHGLIGSPRLTRSSRSHQFFYLNRRPIVNRPLQYGFEEGYRQLLTVGRRPVGVILLEAHPRTVDVNIHPSKREVRFRDEQAMRAAVRDVVRDCLEAFREEESAAQRVSAPVASPKEASRAAPPGAVPPTPDAESAHFTSSDPSGRSGPTEPTGHFPASEVPPRASVERTVAAASAPDPAAAPAQAPEKPVQTDFLGQNTPAGVEPDAVYSPVGRVADAPLQLFETYLLVPEDERLLIIDQHALHERLTYDSLCEELEDNGYEAQQLVVPVLVDVPPSHARLLEQNREVFLKLGIDIEPFGGNTWQITAICHLYDEARIQDTVYKVLDVLAQGDLFDRGEYMNELLRLAVEACRSSIKAGDRLSPEERRGLLDGFRRLRPPYTCPHGRPIIVELTQAQMEKSFRRRQ